MTSMRTNFGNFQSSKERCYVCGDKTNITNSQIKEKSFLSGRNLCDLFALIFDMQIISSDFRLCNECTLKIHKYDKYSIKAANIQQHLKNLHEKNQETQDDFSSSGIFVKDGIIWDIESESDDPEPVKIEIIDSDSDFEQFKVENSEQKSKKPQIESSEVKIVPDTPVFPCTHPSCNKICSSEARLNYHLKFHTTERTIECKTCHKFYKTKTCLRSHMRVHKNAARRLTCDKCSETFANKQVFLRHYSVIHLKLREFICESCGKAFGSSVTLHTHMLIHDESNKIFVCEICANRFYSRSKLNRHMRGHKGKQFACEICHRMYTQRYNVNAHMKSVHGIERLFKSPKSYTCSICGTIFSKNRDLQQHLINVHQAVPGGLSRNYSTVDLKN